MRRSYPQNRRKAEPPAPLSALLTSLRSAARQSQSQIAHKAGMSHTYLSRMESGKSAHPSREKLIRLASALNTNPKELFKAAGYDMPNLPTYRAYLAAKYPHLPSDAIVELYSHFQWIHQKYDVTDQLNEP